MRADESLVVAANVRRPAITPEPLIEVGSVPTFPELPETRKVVTLPAASRMNPERFPPAMEKPAATPESLRARTLIKEEPLTSTVE